MITAERVELVAIPSGYRTHFTGAWVCYSCGHLCDCGEDY